MRRTTNGLDGNQISSVDTPYYTGSNVAISGISPQNMFTFYDAAGNPVDSTGDPHRVRRIEIKFRVTCGQASFDICSDVAINRS